MNNSSFCLLLTLKIPQWSSIFTHILQPENPHHIDLTTVNYKKSISKSCANDQLTPSVWVLSYYLIKRCCNAFLFSSSFAEILTNETSFVNNIDSPCQSTKQIYGTDHLPLTRQRTTIFRCQGELKKLRADSGLPLNRNLPKQMIILGCFF